MSAKHTSGRWVWSGGQLLASQGGHSDCVLIVSDDERFFPIVADRSLIAAAPELLDALRSLDAYWTEDFPEGPEGSRVVLGGLGTIADDTIAIWRKVRAAISKAEGDVSGDAPALVGEAA